MLEHRMRVQLDYGRHPKSRFRSMVFSLLVVTCLILAIGAVTAIDGSTAEIRLDTGDIRHFYFGIPIGQTRMPEPQRSTLLTLSRGSSVLQLRWYAFRPTVHHYD